MDKINKSTIGDRRERAKELLLSGSTKGEIKLMLAEEFGVTPRTAQIDHDFAQNEYRAEVLIAHEQLRVAQAMYMGGYRQSRIVDALIDNWGTGGESQGPTPLLEERALRLVEAAHVQVDAETPKTKEEKRSRLSLWFEDKMMTAGKTRDQIRAAALLMRLEGLADLSEYEPPTDDIVIELGDWRQGFQEQLDAGAALSAKNGNGTGAATNGNGTGTPVNGTNGKK